MIGIVDVSVQAHNVSMPLYPMRAFEGSPSSIRVRSVPKKIGNWQINKVYFAVAYPDNTTQTIECKLVGGVYVGTIAGCNTVGNVQNGYSIYADGVDENGNAVTNYCLGKGDIQILDARGITEPLKNTKFVQILSSEPATPNEGDMWQTSGAWYVWQDGEAWAIGDDSGRIDELSANLTTLVENSIESLSGTADSKFALSDDVASLVSDTAASLNIEISKKADATALTDYALSADVHDELETKADVSSLNVKLDSTSIYPAWVEGNVYDDGDIVTYNGKLYQSYHDYVETPPTEPDDWNEINVKSLLDTKANVSSLTAYALSTDVSAADNALKEWTKENCIEPTTIVYTGSQGNLSGSYLWSGEINRQTMIDSGLYDAETSSWLSGFGTGNFGPTMVIGNSVTSIADNTFEGFNAGYGLVRLYIPRSVVRIGARAFAGSKVEDVYIEDGLIGIGDEAFAGCSSLNRINLPYSIDVDSVGTNVFADCNVLSTYLDERYGIFFDNYNTQAQINASSMATRLGAPLSVMQPFAIASKTWALDKFAPIFPIQYKSIARSTAGANRNKWSVTINDHKTTIVNLTTTSTTQYYVVPGGNNAATDGKMFDAYFVLSVADGVTRPMEWNTNGYVLTDGLSCDMFQGGLSSNIDPESGKTNIYHMFEYADGHVAVEKFDNTYTKTQLDTKLNDYALSTDVANELTLKADISSLPSAISSTVLSTEFEATLPQAAVNAGYYVSTIFYDESEYYHWILIASNSQGLEQTQWQASDNEDATTLYFNFGDGANTYGGCIGTKTKNVLGIVLTSDLSVKQDTLTDNQMSVLNAAVAEQQYKEYLRKTVFDFGNNDITAFNWTGEINQNTITATGLVNSLYVWSKSPKYVRIGTDVSAIGNDTFYRCANLLCVDIPNSVKRLGDAAFNYCTNLKDVNLAEGSLTSTGLNIFQQCWSLSNITLPNSMVQSGSGMFYDCQSLSSVNIPNSLTCVPNGYVSQCINLTSISIPDTATLIDQGAFANCSSLTNIKIPDGVTSIGTYAFRNCDGLTNIKIPDSVLSIGDSAFFDCDGLTNVTIPDSVTDIVYYAFRNCRNLKNMTIGNSVSSIGDQTFLGDTSLTSLVFKGKSMSEVSAMANYPWGLTNTSIISTWNDASQEWVKEYINSLQS